MKELLDKFRGVGYNNVNILTIKKEIIMENKTLEQHENMIAGIAGAFLFSLAGAVIYFLLYMVGYIASISGLVGAVCAIKGYAIFSKKETIKGIVIASVISLLVMVLAWYFSISYEIYDSYQTSFANGEVDFTVSFIEAVRVTPDFLEIPDVGASCFKDLGISLLFCVIGSGSYVFTKIKNAKKQPVSEPVAPASEEVKETTEEVAEDNVAE